MLYHRIQQLLAVGRKWDEMLYLNFEDERLENFGPEDFNRLFTTASLLALTRS